MKILKKIVINTLCLQTKEKYWHLWTEWNWIHRSTSDDGVVYSYGCMSPSLFFKIFYTILFVLQLFFGFFLTIFFSLGETKWYISGSGINKHSAKRQILSRIDQEQNRHSSSVCGDVWLSHLTCSVHLSNCFPNVCTIPTLLSLSPSIPPVLFFHRLMNSLCYFRNVRLDFVSSLTPANKFAETVQKERFLMGYLYN